MLRNSLSAVYAIRSTKVSDLTHSRRIGNFDVSGGLNLFTDEGYRQQLQQTTSAETLTYYQPDMGMKPMNYGFKRGFPFQQVRGFLHRAVHEVNALSLY